MIRTGSFQKRRVNEVQISLITHGPVNVPSYFMSTTAFHLWWEQYKQAELVLNSTFPTKTTDIVRQAKRVVTSDATCAVQSAASFISSLSFVQNNLFREISVPRCLPTVPWLKLKPSAWMMLSRALWLADCSNNSDYTESYKQAEQRAQQAADLLIGYALCDSKIVLIGHAFFNAMIAKELRKKGWTGPLWTDSRNWGCTTYRYSKVFAGKSLEYKVGFTPS
ncbi:histidine phosphatase family protein [Bacillus sp. OTU530]|uniref:histidine phosphatase family protein n=1 Tax=Bacillus sp. OTU530 TaxID=3043862 RepID=UPI00313EE3D4